MAAAMAAAASRSLVSMSSASAARCSGAAARLLSRSSRARMSDRTSPKVDVHPSRLQFGIAALRADLRAGGDEQLGVGVGRDDGADVAAVENGAAGLGGEAALALEQSVADQRVSRDARGDAADRLALQLGVVEVDLRQVAGASPRRTRSRGRRPFEQVEGDRSVEQSGVHVGQAEMRASARGDRALAARRRPVDGDDHAALSVSRAAAKPGKLVSTGVMSSTPIGSGRGGQPPQSSSRRDGRGARRRGTAGEGHRPPLPRIGEAVLACLDLGADRLAAPPPSPRCGPTP